MPCTTTTPRGLATMSTTMLRERLRALDKAWAKGPRGTGCTMLAAINADDVAKVLGDRRQGVGA